MTMARTQLVRRLAGCAALVAALGSGTAVAQEWWYDGSLRVATGDYGGDDDITALILTNEVGWQHGAWFVGLAVPVISQDSPDLRYVGGGPMPVGGGHGGSMHGPGHPGPGGGGHHHPAPEQRDLADPELADPTVTVGLDLYRDPFDRTRVVALGAVKAPVRDLDDGFGTGEWDGGMGALWSRRVGAGRLWAEGWWWRLGDPEEVDLRDPLSLELGWRRPVADGRSSLQLVLRGRTEVVDGGEELVAASAGFSRSLGRRTWVLAEVEGGLTDAAPDLAVAVGIGLR